MKIDTDAIKNTSQQLLSLAGQLKRVAGTGGGEYAGPCPRCGGVDRFRVQPIHNPPRWMCRTCTEGHWQDTIEYGKVVLGLGFKEACDWASGGGNPVCVGYSFPKQEEVVDLEPPSRQWQVAARGFVAYAIEKLWASQPALSYLRVRGLSDEAIGYARLGWNPAEMYRPPHKWGLDGKDIWLPGGITIPFEAEGHIWRVDIRTLAGEKVMPRGARPWRPWNFDQVDQLPVVLVEGVIDALTIHQVAGDAVTPVAIGCASHCRTRAVYSRLGVSRAVLVAFDRDQAGDTASSHWVEHLGNALRWRPLRKDVNQMLQDGLDVRKWVMTGLATIGNDQ